MDNVKIIVNNNLEYNISNDDFYQSYVVLCGYHFASWISDENVFKSFDFENYQKLEEVINKSSCDSYELKNI